MVGVTDTKFSFFTWTPNQSTKFFHATQSGFGVTCAKDLWRRLGEHVGGVPVQSSPKIGGQRTKIKIIDIMIAKNQTFLSAWPTFKTEDQTTISASISLISAITATKGKDEMRLN